ncbi:substrate-specific component bioy of biotin ecf transporter [hydrocarbon metagenome]|uniref:Substrate-specific component bioy of biotin ecf transporter n=1 Tax=hydrocarbon metagenome TaxID=938273 RepID=A0A0W8E8P5_9ZZZZ
MSTKELVRAALFTAVICVVTILVRMFQPVVVIPFSLQPLIMLLAGYLLSPRAAFLSMSAYIMLGLIGIPVFSVPPYGGPAYILVPSFGFLLGMPLAAWVASRVIRVSKLWNFILAGIAGIIVLYAVGLPYMYIILNFYLEKAVDVMQIIKIGALPFLVFDLIKITVAAFLAVDLSRRLNIERIYTN